MSRKHHSDDVYRLPELRETSPFGRLLRRLLLPLTIAVLALLAWAGYYTLDVLDLQLDLPAAGGLPTPTGKSP